MLIQIEKLDLTLQTRAGTDAETIDNYAEAMKDGEEFPPVDVFTDDGETFWLADGFHRVMAAKQNGRTCIQANVHEGRADDAVVFGGTANNKQGKRPTRADVRHFLEMVWARRENIFGGTPTGGFFAQKCGVAKRTGELFVREMLANCPPAPVRPSAQNAHLKTPQMPVMPQRLIGANGKTYACPQMPKMPTRTTTTTTTTTVTRTAPCDRYGVEIPPEITAAFDGAERVKEVAKLVSEARCAIRRAFDAEDVAFGAVRQDAIIQLDNAYRFIASALPHCVCRMCQGEGCQACHNRGWQTEEEYERNPTEFKAV